MDNERKNKIEYHKEGDYYVPNLVLPKDEYPDYCIGKYGRLRLNYLKENKKAEYVKLEELEKAIEETKALIKRTDPETRFEYKERKLFNSWWDSYDGYYNGYGSYGSWVNNKKDNSKGISVTSEYYFISFYGVSGEEVEFIDAVSEVEAIGQFLINHPDLTYNDIFNFGLEEDYDWSIGGDNQNHNYGYDTVTL